MKRAFDEFNSDSSSDSGIKKPKKEEDDIDLILDDEDEQNINIRNKHYLDDDIEFDPIPHKYRCISGHEFSRSVTGLIDIVGYDFPAEFRIACILRYDKPISGQKPWETRVSSTKSEYYDMNHYDIHKKWYDSRMNGSYLHDCVDQFYNNPQKGVNSLSGLDTIRKFFFRNTGFNKKELSPYVEAFVKSHATLSRAGWKIYRTEWRIYSKELDVAGSIDAVFRRMTKKRTYEYKIVDWKFNDKDFDIVHGEKYLQYPWDYMPNTKTYKYGGQLNLYAFILNKHYGIKVSGLELHQFDNKGHNEIIDVPINAAPIKELFQAWSQYRDYRDVMNNAETCKQFLVFPDTVTFQYHPNVK